MSDLAFAATNIVSGRIWNKHTKLSCAINPQAMEEVRFEIKKTDSPKNVVVIGGGPGGMEQPELPQQKGTK